MSIDEALQNSLCCTPHAMSEQLSYNIWGSVVTTTRAFGKVQIKINPHICMIFIEVKLRWWARSKKLRVLHDIWLKRAEERIESLIPKGWRFLIHYGKRNDKYGVSDKGSGNKGSGVDDVGKDSGT